MGDKEYTKPLYEYASEYLEALGKAKDETLDVEIKLKDLLKTGWNSLRTMDGKYLGYDEEDFTEEELESLVKTDDEYFTDGDGFPYLKIEFIKE